MFQFAVKCRFDIKEKALISLIIRALCIFDALKSDPPGIYVMILCDFYRFYMVLLINILRCVVYLLIAHKTLYAQKRGE